MRHDQAKVWRSVVGTAVVAGLVTIGGCSQNGPGSLSAVSATRLPPLRFDAAVQTILDAPLDDLQQLVSRNAITAAVVLSNRQTVDLSGSEIQDLDRRWQQGGDGERWVDEVLDSEVSRVLDAFLKENEDFAEILVTDVHGCLVGATHRTSDFYHADEAWWQTAYNDGEGATRCGEIEYGESAGVEGVSMLVAIRDPESGRLIGALKAVYRLTALKAEL